jgi:hypothetical protein
MTILDRFSLSTAIVAVAALGATGGNIAALLGPQSDLWGLPQTLASLKAMQAASTELDGQHETMARLIAARSELGNQVARGELTLLAGAERMRELDRQRPCRFQPTLPPVAGSSEQEQACRRLIQRVRLDLLDRKSEDVASVCDRLEAELRETFHPESVGKHVQ